MEDLVEKLLAGSRESWNELLERYGRLVYKVFYTKSFGFSRDEIEELFNDFVVSLMKDDFRKIRLFEGRNDCSLASYLKKIAINMAIDRRKRLIKRRMTSLFTTWEGKGENDDRRLVNFIDSGAKNPRAVLISREESVRFLDSLYRLEPLKLLIVILIVYHGYDREELGRLVDKTRQNIDVIFNRCKGRLKSLAEKPLDIEVADDVPGDWSSNVREYREQMTLGDREALFKHCIGVLSVPQELLVALIFLNAPALAPTPDRISLVLENRSKPFEKTVEETLEKAVGILG